MEGYAFGEGIDYICCWCGAVVARDFWLLDLYDGSTKLATSIHTEWHKRMVA